MKIFKKLFITFVFSLFFIISVNADTYTLQYSESNIQRYEEYKQLVDNAREYALSNNLIDNNKIVYYDFSYLSYNLIRVYYITGNYNSSNRRFYRQVYDLTFDSNYNITRYSTGSSGYFEDFMSNIVSHGYFDYNFGSSTTYTVTMDVDTLVGSNHSLLMYANQPTNFYDFVQALSFDIKPEPVNPNKCISYDVAGQLGVVRNVKSISFRVHDTSNALDFPIEGYFHLVSSQFNGLLIPISDYLDVNISPGPLNEGDYNFNYNMYWVNESGNTINDLTTPRFAIYFDYNMIAEDDIDTYLDVIITLTIKNTIPAGNVTFFDSPVDIYGNIYNCNYDLISYGYVDNDNNYTSSDSVLLNFLQDNNFGNISPLVNTDLIGNGPVDSILLLPLNIMQSLLNVFNSNTCQPLVLPLPYLNKNLTLPCVNTLYSQIEGLSTFLNWFSAIVSAFILYEYFIRLYKWVDNLLTFRENNHFGGF